MARLRLQLPQRTSRNDDRVAGLPLTLTLSLPPSSDTPSMGDIGGDSNTASST